LPPLDVIILSHVLEHLRDPVGTLALLRQHMTSRGVLFIEVPHTGRGALRSYPDSPWAPRHDEPHLTFFDEQTLGNLLRVAGFAPVYTSTAGPMYREISPRRYRLPPLRTTLRRLVPPPIMKRLRQSGSRYTTLEDLAPAFRQYGGRRIWVRSVSRPT
jgi:hypothetical protein